ncbi:MSMEG_0570 family nitrogen starvation response protein [Acetobacter lambici]|uniref:MSMEG_0570 family nitrogen starvation response protein n=1 Tax=Acetobacter lambici TaxID=1332824 RepID=A0ABT1F248_9PROT|nr:MSMEG_0570 family nitrogen starvation response protein [Acetobacter lambici]MCP1243333.1 MSMEG_0570 family nitrogen starvation response protein [Acetobacter lambici]MCP1259292.1 MSMEG_0570 family nitrogen starvation response protein [Acetobacter lambici]NHO57523.1 MSMEG_0570 family nitrogen starvation response protein [Acetobacter lambici]
MPEMTFRVRWPDGKESDCYSPSLVIRDHFTPGQDYPIRDFLEKADTALTQASERVRARYGFPCSRALGQLAAIRQASASFLNQADAQVRVLSFRS